MKSIHTLIPDVYELLEKRHVEGKQEFLGGLGKDVEERLRLQWEQSTKAPSLRLSQLGEKCPKALWHSIHTPERAERLPAYAQFKYSYGHIIEAYAVALAREAGHTVEGEQDVVSVDGIKGHRDCVIDGCIVDVKSASSLSYIDFKNKNLKSTYSLGYLAQLDGYMVGSYDDPLVTNKDQAYLWVIDEQLGHMCLYEHTKRESFIRERIRNYKAIVSLTGPPDCTCETVSYGDGGNIALGTDASYSPFKFECFPHLRTFLYSRGPVFFTHVAKLPRNKDGPIPEVDRNGKYVYH